MSQLGIAARVRRSMLSLVIGRPISAMAGFFVLALMARWLPSEDYGSYFTVWALAEILILSSNCGLIHAVYRYVSSTTTGGRNVVPHGPVWQLIGWRAVSLSVTALIVLSAPLFVGQWFGSAVAEELAFFLAIIVLGEGGARFIETVFDSMLLQGCSQITLIARTFVRLLGVIWLGLGNGLTLQGVLIVELCAGAMGAMLGFSLLAAIYLRKSRSSPECESISKIGIRRMISFAVPAYAAQLVGLSYGPDALKLVLSGISGASAVAVFGFSYSLASVVQRYMPVNLLAGIFRPIFVAASKREEPYSVLSDLASMTIKINWIVVFAAITFCYFASDPLLTMISAGKYADAGGVLTLLLIGLGAVSVHSALSMYCLAAENSWLPFVATCAAGSGLLLGAFLGSAYGAHGMAVAFGLAEVIWGLVCYFLLRVVYGGVVRLDVVGLAKLISAALLSVCVFSLMQYVASLSWYVVSSASAFSFIAFSYVFRVFSVREMVWLGSVLPLKRFGFLVKPKEEAQE